MMTIDTPLGAVRGHANGGPKSCQTLSFGIALTSYQCQPILRYTGTVET